MIITTDMEGRWAIFNIMEESFILSLTSEEIQTQNHQ